MNLSVSDTGSGLQIEGVGGLVIISMIVEGIRLSVDEQSPVVNEAALHQKGEGVIIGLEGGAYSQGA